MNNEEITMERFRRTLFKAEGIANTKPLEAKIVLGIIYLPRSP